jgi:CheY-like chemotaxis protein
MARILVIDDDETVRELLRFTFEQAGYEVVEASDGDMGMQRYREQPTDLIIMDIFMPEKGGLESIMELRRDFPDVKIIAISGGGTVGSGWPTIDALPLAKRLGALRTLAKPFHAQEMLEAVREALAEGGIQQQ